MHETCDGCGQQFEVLEVIFTGRECLCPQCFEAKKPTEMGMPHPIVAVETRAA